MEKQKTNVEKAQSEESTKRGTSLTYTIKSFTGNIEKLKEAELLNEETLKRLNEAKKEIAEKYMRKELGL